MPVARKAGLADLGELVAGAQALGDDDALMTAVVEAMTTNESFFFRDKMPFEHFRSTIMPALLAARSASRTIRIWCAAASTGQEPYSLAMCLKEMEREIAGWRIEILATDLSGEVLEKARQGIYSQFEVQRGLPIQLLIKHFTQVGELWQIAPDIRAMVKYRQLNLLVGFLPSRHFRPDLLPQRADLFRPADQDRRARPPGAGHRRATAIWCSARPRPWSVYRQLQGRGDKRGLYAPNARRQPLAAAQPRKPAPRLVGDQRRT